MKETLTLISILLLLTACQEVPLMSGKIAVTINETKPSITEVKIENDQLIIIGKNLEKVTTAKVEGSTHHTFEIESKTSDKLILNAKSALSFLVGQTFNLIVSNAQAATTFPITFELQNGQVTAAKLHHMGASSGQVLRFNGTNWAPASISSSQVFAGAYDASTDNPDIAALGGTAGTYYVVSVAGSQDLGTGVISFDAGDWVIYNGSVWEKLSVGSNTVTSFNGRTGLINPSAGDYSWSMLTKAVGKLTGSKLSEIADVDVAGIQDGDILQWNAGGSKWEVVAVPAPAITAGSITNSEIANSAIDSNKIVDGTIVNADVSATAAIAQSKIQNLTTDLGNKEPLLPTGGTTAQYLRGDKTLATLDTLAVPENSNLYFTPARVLGTLITSYATGGTGPIVVTDTIPQALSKLETKTNSLGNYVLRDGTSAMTGDLQMGNHKITGLTDPIANQDAATKAYVDSVAGGSGSSQWTTAGANIHFNTGNVGVRTTTPSAPLNVTNSTGDSILLGDWVGNGVNKHEALAQAPAYNSATDKVFTLIGGNSYLDRDEVLIGGSTNMYNQAATQNIIFYTTPTKNTSMGTERMRIDRDGKVSIENQLLLKSNGSSNYVAFNAPAGLSGNLSLTFPATTGSNNQVLTTNGAGVLSWTTPAGGGAPTGAAGGELSGTYPNPTIANGLAATKIGAGAVDNTEFSYLNAVTGPIQTQLDAKEPTITAGTTAQYLRGNKTLGTFDTDVLAALLPMGFTPSGAGDVAPLDSMQTALAKLQGQLDTHDTSIAAATTWTKSGSVLSYLAGNVGVGVSTPAAQLHVSSDSLISHASASNWGPQFTMVKMRGTTSSPTALITSDQLGTINFGGFTSTSTYNSSAAMIQGAAAGNFTTTSNPTALLFSTTPTGATSPITRMTIRETGDVEVAGTLTGATVSAGTLYGSQLAMNGVVPGGVLSTFRNNAIDGTSGMQFTDHSGNLRGFLGHINASTVAPYPANTMTVMGVGAPLTLGVSGYEVVRIDTAGKTTIGTLNAAFNLEVGNRLNIVGAGAKLQIAGSDICNASGCVTPSDKRLKKDIHPIQAALLKITQLQGVEYYYKDKAKFGDQKKIGFIAQDVEKIFPEAVVTGEKSGLKAVAYDHLVAPIIEAIKELFGMTKENSREIASLKDKNKKLEEENAAIKAYLCQKDPEAPICK